jgi:23S rRNA (guanine1835-N2)-methyltransferase
VIISFKGREYRLDRYPKSDNNSLQAGSAADEHLLRYLDDLEAIKSPPVIYHDRFGALTVSLNAESPLSIILQKSQENSILKNLEKNGLSPENIRFAKPLGPLPQKSALGLIRIPKSLDLFRYYLQHLSLSLSLDSDSLVLCSFMTKHFSPRMLTIADEFFESVHQSLAWKKSRLLILTQPRLVPESSPLISVSLDDHISLRQYPGVFSSRQIDTATRFLIDHLELRDGDRRILDLGCGNGVIGLVIQQKVPEAELHFLDDNWLAVESAKLNIDPGHAQFHWADTTGDSGDGYFDLVVTNPPFHFEHEIDLTVPLRLFKEARRILKPGGVLQLVANRHLNYSTHLVKLFDRVAVVASNSNFEVLRCEEPKPFMV